MSNKCTKDNHLKLVDMYCKACQVMVCRKCLSTHSHQVHDYEEVFDGIMSDSDHYIDTLNDLINQKIDEKEMIDLHFNNVIERHYQQQIDTISDQFTFLHDLLTHKELLLKKLLKSHHNNNTSILHQQKLTLNKEILHYVNSLEEFNNLSSTNNNNNNNNNNNDGWKLKFIENYYKSISAISSTSNSTTKSEYEVYSFESYSIKTMSNIINAMELLNDPTLKINPLPEPKSTLDLKYSHDVYFYRINNGNVSLINVNNREIERIENLNTIVPTISSYFYQSTVINGNIIYLFGVDKYYKVEIHLKDKKCLWESFEYPTITIPNLHTSVSDGKSKIYFIGGRVTKAEILDSIWSFDTNTMEFELIAKLDIASISHSCSYDPVGKFIYKIGGFNGELLRSIDRLNLEKKSMEVVLMLDEDVVCGCLVGVDYIYFLTVNSTFYSYNLKTKEQKLLSSIKQNEELICSKLYQQHQDTLYLVVNGETNLFRYNIENDKWDTLNLFKNEPLEFINFISPCK
ncbi:hypothetical protein DLAC_11769 [Tieghemostelium lacteum]|uniref:B box-type domain-containing protein n=1 Tax=Tieghemostelium lacteum TaxID=361077 RepID=A0A151Z9Q7_TIELA|nr:hypothetical protein DLAC_11769 [Tieghemostelium lacteum]|eukprot:KYQ90688.1 hypothetical protein DLAC_11769 [Tieghemostelium lacteum]